MQLIIGLGNPDEPQYALSRHNAGALFLDYLQAQFSSSSWQHRSKFSALISKIDVHGHTILLAKPQTFMNLSGQSVRAIVDYYHVPLEELLIAFDDLDLNLGEYKLQSGTGPHGHHGLESIYQHLGTKQFSHLRLGIDTRAGERVIPSADYVLQQFSQSELASLQAVFGMAAAKSLALKNVPTP
ncbi:aminoacyl-tRNA hydrolase [Microgenomates group bacterium]|nr:aminoacyl-tRNA hydrolase [Microgenomates group bacterium]